jgi:hypothetical protein
VSSAESSSIRRVETSSRSLPSSTAWNERSNDPWGLADLSLHRGELSFPAWPSRLHDLSPPINGILEEIASGQRGEEALDHSVLKFIGPQAILIALLGSRSGAARNTRSMRTGTRFP